MDCQEDGSLGCFVNQEILVAAQCATGSQPSHSSSKAKMPHDA